MAASHLANIVSELSHDPLDVTFAKSQLERLHYVDADTFQELGSLDPLGELLHEFKSSVKRDSMFAELRRLTNNNKLRLAHGEDVERVPSVIAIWSDTSCMQWVILDDSRFVAVILGRTEAFMVFFVPERLC
jgi:hypothetical protein